MERGYRRITRSRSLLYAAYGSNLHPHRLRERVAGAVFAGAGYLQECTLRFHKRGRDQSAKCGLSDCGRGTHVAVFEIDAAGKRILDDIEGLGKGYDDCRVTVPGFGTCFTYRASRSHIDESLRPYDWYRDLVLLGCRAHAFPAEYCERVAAVPVIADPDPVRRRKNRQTVERIKRSQLL